MAALSGDSASWREGLTRREAQVCALIADGYSNKEIAMMLFIGHRTVEDYRGKAMRKLGVHNVVKLVRKVLGA